MLTTLQPRTGWIYTRYGNHMWRLCGPVSSVRCKASSNGMSRSGVPDPQPGGIPAAAAEDELMDGRSFELIIRELCEAAASEDHQRRP